MAGKAACWIGMISYETILICICLLELDFSEKLAPAKAGMVSIYRASL
jgi:hypothetical protein